MSTDKNRQKKKEFDDLSSLQTFNSYVKKYGFSISNFYDVHFVPKLIDVKSNNISYVNTILKRTPTTSSATGIISGGNEIRDLMRYYADECSLPGFQIATGEYRINNSPMMKYAYGTVNSELNVSFICDGRSEVKKTFDAWKEYIHASAIPRIQSRVSYNINTVKDLNRSRYRDDYTCDIVIIKFERGNSSDVNKSTRFLADKTVIPDYIAKELGGVKSKGFGYAIPTYSVRLVNAFPVNVSSVSLSSGASDLTKVQVSFEYDAMYTSAVSGTGTVQDVIQTNASI